MLVRLFRRIANRPLESIECILAFTLFLTGIWLVSPFYEPESATAARLSGGSHTLAIVMGIFQIILAIPLLYALKNLDWPLRQRIRRLVTFIVFCLFVFYMVGGILINGLHRISWVPTLSLALISGVAHVRLKWETG